jgi:hypothetical protein
LATDMTKRLAALLSEDSGTSLVEFTLIASLLIAVTGGVVDFTFALYQWSCATKAVQQGARLAAVSDPVSSDLKTLTGLEGGALPGDPFPAFTRVCNGSTSSCSGGTYDANAMATLVYGREGPSTCGSLGADGFAGMCDIFGSIQPTNVIVTYTQSGLGFAGRPGGPVPTITVQLTGLSYNLIFLGTLLGGAQISMPALSATVTGEDLRTTN